MSSSGWRSHSYRNSTEDTMQVCLFGFRGRTSAWMTPQPHCKPLDKTALAGRVQGCIFGDYFFLSSCHQHRLQCHAVLPQHQQRTSTPALGPIHCSVPHLNVPFPSGHPEQASLLRACTGYIHTAVKGEIQGTKCPSGFCPSPAEGRD